MKRSLSRSSQPFLSLPLIGKDSFERLLCELECEFGACITLHDRAAIFRDASGQSVFSRSRFRHRHSFCELGRRDHAGWNQNCLSHCRIAVNAEALHREGAFVHHCWKGAKEVVVPLMRDGVHLATFFLGPYRGQSNPKVRPLPDFLQRAWNQLPETDAQRLESLSRIMHATALGLLAELEKIHQIQKESSDRKTRVRRFLYFNAQKEIGLKDLANFLFLSLSRTSHIVRELFGVSFQELLLQDRLNRAKFLLNSSTYKVREIAERVGIPNEHYFNRAFKKRVGMSPGRFRLKQLSSIRRS
jgi:AraC-like DNA-binding protein